jgi:SAM-dependent methyltransferase
VTPPYRDFAFPLNVLMHVLAREGQGGDAMHYGLFEREGETLAAAQERSTALLFERLPPPPGRVLEVGSGLGATLERLRRSGYDAVGITPDASQARAARDRFGEGFPVRVAPLESFEDASRYDVVVFQESSQYIESRGLWSRVARLAAPGGLVLVLDEFALLPVDRSGALHRLDAFLAAAAAEGFVVEEHLDLSLQAAPTISWFLERLPRHRASIASELPVAAPQLDALLESGAAYRELYRGGDYGYRLLRFRAPAGG